MKRIIFICFVFSKAEANFPKPIKSLSILNSSIFLESIKIATFEVDLLTSIQKSFHIYLYLLVIVEMLIP